MNVRDVSKKLRHAIRVSKTPVWIAIRGCKSIWTRLHRLMGFLPQIHMAGTGFGLDVFFKFLLKAWTFITAWSRSRIWRWFIWNLFPLHSRRWRKSEVSGSWMRDNFGFNENPRNSWNTDKQNFLWAQWLLTNKKDFPLFLNATMNFIRQLFWNHYSQSVALHPLYREWILWFAAPRQCLHKYGEVGHKLRREQNPPLPISTSF